MKLLWTGTDSLMLVDYSMRSFRKKVYWWIFRRLIRIMDFFIQEHYCDSKNVADHVRTFGTRKLIKVVPDKIEHVIKYNKKEHEGINVLYYLPHGNDRKFIKWLYGYDIFLNVKKAFPNINFIVVDGTYMMEKIYPIVDFYIRPNRHDGACRTIQECNIQKIPYYWSQTKPDYFEICKMLNNLEDGNII